MKETDLALVELEQLRLDFDRQRHENYYADHIQKREERRKERYEDRRERRDEREEEVKERYEERAQSQKLEFEKCRLIMGAFISKK